MPTVTADDHDTAVNRLLRLPEREFDDAVVAHVCGRQRTAAEEDVFRDPEVVERTYESIRRILDRLEVTVQREPDRPGLQFMLRRLRREAGVVRPLANEAREGALRADRSLSPRKRAERRLLRELLEDNPDLQRRLVGYVKDERAKDAQ